jgi:hypothetical protein
LRGRADGAVEAGRVLSKNAASPKSSLFNGLILLESLETGIKACFSFAGPPVRQS